MTGPLGGGWLRVNARRRCSCALIALGVAAAAGAPIAAGDPNAPAPPAGSDVGSCAFTLSTPQSADVGGGTSGVTATLTPGKCSGQPVTSVVCVTSPSGRTDCGKSYAFDIAHVTMVASPLTGRFTATGKGCWHPAGHIADYVCETSGPVAASF